MTYHKVSDKHLDEFIAISEKEGHTYKTREEARDSAQRLYRFAELALDLSIQEQARKKRLESEPKGFTMAGEGRNCSLCHQMVYDRDGWYDKWGFKCMNCQDAVNKKKIPGSLCGDWKNEKCVTDSELSWRSNLHNQTIRKLIRRSKIKARQIPNGPYMILRKDNPNLLDVIEAEQGEQKAKK